jgi:hypothetical protein
MTHLGPLVRVRSAEPRAGCNACVVFEDDTERLIDLEPYLHGPIFEPMRKDPVAFLSMKVEEGTIGRSYLCPAAL